MKVQYLHIRNYKQFSDLELDLTYPKGHKKEGEPLDKICIIGQSGTGKTNLLDIIKKSTIDFSKQPENSYLPFSEFIGKDTDDRYINTKFLTRKRQSIETFFEKLASKIIFTKSDKLNSLEDEKAYFVGVSKTSNLEINHKSLNQIKSKNFMQRNIIDINDEAGNLWITMKEKIDNYKIERSNYLTELSNKILTDDIYDKKHFKEDVEIWEEENENLLENIADDINFILKKFNLELTKIDENQQSYNGLIIKDLSNNSIIKYDDLSTGTKNLLSTLIPLKTYKPKDSIILIDEPEMSFYPDMQRQLTDLYMKVGNNNQLILATHSPIIASSFEPWEVVELKFNKDNQIYREKYYDGDNHIDNYTIDPRMLTWTGILTDVFDLKEDSNFTFREKKLMEYATLKSEIKQMTDMAEKEKAFEKLKKVSKILGIYN